MAARRVFSLAEMQREAEADVFDRYQALVALPEAAGRAGLVDWLACCSTMSIEDAQAALIAAPIEIRRPCSDLRHAFLSRDLVEPSNALH